MKKCIISCKAFNLFNDDHENFDNNYYDDAINYYSQAKNLCNSENMRDKCNENIGHCYYNKGNHLYRKANLELEFKNTIEMEKLHNLIIKIEMI